MTPGSIIVHAIQRYQLAQENYINALKEYRHAKRTDDDLRKLHRQNLARDIAEANGSNFNNEHDKLLHTEDQHKSNRRIKYVVKPEARAGVKCVLIPARTEYPNCDDSFDHKSVDNMWTRITPKNGKDITSWERISDKNEMETMMLRWQQLHFLQANETPLSSSE